MKTVAVESPYAATDLFTIEQHEQYARLCMRDSLLRGEAPFLSHLLYTQVLLDEIPGQRQRGIAAGLSVSECLDMAAAYTDLGVSPGMAAAIGRYALLGKQCEHRLLWEPNIGRAVRDGRLAFDVAVRLLDIGRPRA